MKYGCSISWIFRTVQWLLDFSLPVSFHPDLVFQTLMFQQYNVESRNWTYRYRSDLVFRFSWDIVLSPFSDPKIQMFESLDFCCYARLTVPIYMFPLHQGSLLRLNQCVALCAFSLIFVRLCCPRVCMEIVWAIDKSAQRSLQISLRHLTFL